MIDYNEKLKIDILEYYKDYYKGLGLNDFQIRAEARLDEDLWELTRLKKLEKKISYKIGDFERHLIVGLGTGGLTVALNQLGVKYISGIEPYAPALRIAQEKAVHIGLAQSSFIKASAESLPYYSGEFDFIHCFSVLEHVQDVRHSIREMYRVLRKGGILYIHTPNYAWPYEGHYKVPAPTFMPFGKQLTKLWLKMLGRPVDYLESINLYSAMELSNILEREVGLYYRIFSKEDRRRQIPAGSSLRSRAVKSIYSFFDNCLNVYPFQEIVVVKQ